MNKINVATALFILDGPNPAPDAAAAADLLFASEIDWSVLAIIAEHPQFTTGATGFAGPVLTPQQMESLATADLMAGDAATAETAQAIGLRPVTQSVRRGQPALSVGRYLDENPTDLVVVDSPHLAGDLVDDGIVPVLVMPSSGVKPTDGPVLLAIDESPLDDVVTSSATRLFDPSTTNFVTVHVEAPDPASGILAMAQQRDASMIVLGTHNRGWLSRLFQPSVADAVLQHTQRPVLLMSAPDDSDTR